ncbi:hypothetical protein CBF29_06385 [Vagococcus elongatus]|uniref:Uncharacterized protein n=1 Tax=Vagococcus elongatus TaxID=180344 RepID=A0A430AVY2_9ENTE|nr:hypothetical protein CBF29_06385 [Vagococcus elongatus]
MKGNKDICHIEFKNGWGVNAVETPNSEYQYSILTFTHVNGEVEYDIRYLQTDDLDVLLGVIERVFNYEP